MSITSMMRSHVKNSAMRAATSPRGMMDVSQSAVTLADKSGGLTPRDNRESQKTGIGSDKE